MALQRPAKVAASPNWYTWKPFLISHQVLSGTARWMCLVLLTSFEVAPLWANPQHLVWTEGPSRSMLSCVSCEWDSPCWWPFRQQCTFPFAMMLDLCPHQTTETRLAKRSFCFLASDRQLRPWRSSLHDQASHELKRKWCRMYHAIGQDERLLWNLFVVPPTTEDMNSQSNPLQNCRGWELGVPAPKRENIRTRARHFILFGEYFSWLVWLQNLHGCHREKTCQDSFKDSGKVSSFLI